MDTRKLLEILNSNPGASGALGGLAGSLLGSVLSGRGGGKSLVKAGGLATIGYLAWQAWQKHQASRGGSQPAALPAAFDLTLPNSGDSAVSVVRAMVAASKSDGVVEPAERDRIFARVGELGLSRAEQQEVGELLAKPLDMEAVVAGASSPEVAAQIYTASALAILPANRAERAYLDMLAARLGLDAGLAQQLERAIENA